MRKSRKFISKEFWEEFKGHSALGTNTTEADNLTHAAKTVFNNADESDHEEDDIEIHSDHNTDGE